MSTVLQNLIEHSLGDGARSAKYECLIALPDSSFFPDTDALTTLAKASSFPGKTHEIVDIKFKGRTIPVKGQVKYTQSWECTFYLTEDHHLKTAFETWLEALDQHHNYADLNSEDPSGVNLMKNTLKNFNSYTYPLVIQQLNFDLDYAPIQYFLHNAFPTAISQVETSAESVGTILEFTVTFSYSHYTTSTFIEEKTGVEALTDKVVSYAEDIVDKGVNYITDFNKDITSKATNPFVEGLQKTSDVKSAQDIKQKMID